MSSNRTIVIVGGALAGPAAAARAREVDGGARIVLLERASAISYAVGGLAQHVSGETKNIADLDREGVTFFRDVYDVEVRTGVEVTRIDAHARALETSQGHVPWDALIYAAGVRSVMPDVPGLLGGTNVFCFRNLIDLRSIVTNLRRAKRVAVLGGGFFGVEICDALTRRGVPVVLIERGDRLLPGFAKGASHAARASLMRAGAVVETGAEVTLAERRGDRVKSLRLADGRDIACDLVVVAVGVLPRTELLRDAGAKLVAHGAVRIDGSCRTSLPNVYACGTCVALEHAISGRHIWNPQAAPADRAAQVAGAVAAGGRAFIGPVLGTAIVRAGAVTIARTGLTPEEAEHADVARVHGPSHDPFVPGATPISIELLFDPSGGALLGADVWGETGVDKRIDVLATALAGGLDARDLAQLDLAYAPPFSRARDVVNVAGAVADADSPPLSWSPESLEARLSEVEVIDVTAPGQKSVVTITGGRSVTLAELRGTGEGATFAATKPLVFVSSDGTRGYQAARIAVARGATDAGFLSGGLTSWQAEGKRTVTRSAPKPQRAARPAPKASAKTAKTARTAKQQDVTRGAPARSLKRAKARR